MARSTDEPREPLVARRQRRVRRELALTALEMFTERGYDRTTVEEIVDAVEVSPSTFYRYFPSKCDLVLELHRIGTGELVCGIAERPPGESLADALDASILAQREEIERDMVSLRHFQDLLAENPELRGRLLAEQHSGQGVVAEVVAPRLGAAPGDLRSQVVAAAILSTTLMALDRWSTGSGDMDPVDVVRSAYRVLAPLFEP